MTAVQQTLLTMRCTCGPNEVMEIKAAPDRAVAVLIRAFKQAHNTPACRITSTAGRPS